MDSRDGVEASLEVSAPIHDGIPVSFGVPMDSSFSDEVDLVV